MREIKFRAWDNAKDVMVLPFTLETFYKDNGSINFGTTVFMQFTGLTDRNGVEIYEGDILKGFCYDDEPYQVELFPDGGFEYAWPEYGNDSDNVEVIGNIYENPDLLTS